MKKTIFILLCVAAITACSKQENQERKPFNPEEYPGGLYQEAKVPSGDLIMESDNVDITVYLPADYKETGEKYPVLYLLHGMNGDQKDWKDYGNVVGATDAAIRGGTIKPFIIVMPNAFTSFYVDGFSLFDGWPGHKYETFFFTGLIPYIEANYPVLTDKGHTAIAGLSMGGYGASLYAFKYPEKFCMSYSMSGATAGLDWIWSEDDEDIVPSIEKIFKNKGYGKSDFERLPAYFMDCGTEDILCKGFNDSTHEYLDSIGFPHVFREYEGHHEWSYWRACYKRMLPDLAKYFDR